MGPERRTAARFERSGRSRTGPGSGWLGRRRPRSPLARSAAAGTGSRSRRSCTSACCRAGSDSSGRACRSGCRRGPHAAVGRCEGTGTPSSPFLARADGTPSLRLAHHNREVLRPEMRAETGRPAWRDHEWARPTLVSRVQSLLALARSRRRLAAFSVARIPPVRGAPCGLASHPAVLRPPSKDLGHATLARGASRRASLHGGAILFRGSLMAGSPDAAALGEPGLDLIEGRQVQRIDPALSHAPHPNQAGGAQDLEDVARRRTW